MEKAYVIHFAALWLYHFYGSVASVGQHLVCL